MPVNTVNYPPAGSPVRARWRCRPDGSQEWRCLSLSPSKATALRRRASACGVTADAWLNIALAVSQVSEALQGLPGVLEAAPTVWSADARLRAWQAYLEEQDGPALHDELPEAVFSRSACRGADVTAIDVEALLEVSDHDWDLGRRCEIRAAGLRHSLPTFIRMLAEGTRA